VQAPFDGLTLLSSEAAASSSALTATFSFVLPATYDASALDFIYANGPLSSDGSIGQHTVRSLQPAGAVQSSQHPSYSCCCVALLSIAPLSRSEGGLILPE